jgi:peptidoglycan/xylan/chitin deacetylase (PgdA/CDA1 family)
MEPTAVLSVDVEFFSDIPAYPPGAPVALGQSVGVEGVNWILDALARAKGQSTFFVVSRIAEDRPADVEQIAEAGHEIASHTRTHRHLSELSAAERRIELVDSRETLESTAGVDVTGFRAPSFDTADGHLSQLREAGYEYDSSQVPARSIPGWYGGTTTRKRPYVPDSEVTESSTPLIEVPVGVMPGLRLPLSGTWLRFLGVRYTIAGMRALAKRGIVPVLYVHPWEFVDLPDIDGVPSRVYWRTGAYMKRAVERILQTEFEFVTLTKLLERERPDRTPAPK